MRGLWKLAWLETKIFVREPLGVVGAVGVPVLVFVVLGRIFGRGYPASWTRAPRAFAADLPVFASILIALGAVLSLVTIISIYREGGILKRLRATPLRPSTILTAHVLVKLLLTAATLAAMVAVGRRYSLTTAAPLLSFGVALLFSTLSILSMGFVIASVVPTARFAQPIGTLVFYPMLALSGLFVPVDAFPPVLQAVARASPLTYAVSLLSGIWHGDGWSTHLGDVAALALTFVACTAVSSKVFRWE
jgi:ABC-2 type transport system permease protein